MIVPVGVVWWGALPTVVMLAVGVALAHMITTCTHAWCLHIAVVLHWIGPLTLLWQDGSFYVGRDTASAISLIKAGIVS